MTKVNDCWNRIGLWGDRSCGELERAIHCRNCPVYARAAADLFDREVDAQYLFTAAEQIRSVERREERGSESAFIFRLGSEWLAFDAPAIDDVCALRSIHSLPHRRGQEVLGIVNVRGALVVCVSLHVLLGIDKEAPSEGRRQLVPGRLVIARHGNERVAFPTDEIHGIHHYHASRLGEPPTTLIKSAATYTRATLHWQERTVGMLDCGSILESLNRSLASA